MKSRFLEDANLEPLNKSLQRSSSIRLAHGVHASHATATAFVLQDLFNSSMHMLFLL